MSTIEINDVVGVPHVSVEVRPGVTLFRGPNDSGKSLLIECMKVIDTAQTDGG